MGSVSSRGFSGEGKAPRRSWRSGSDAEPRPKRGSSQPSWAAGGSGGGGGVRRWVGGVLLTGIALALFGGFAYFVFIKPRATPLICWHVTDYEAPLVPQAFAQEDIDRLLEHFYSSGLSAGQISTGPSKSAAPANVSTGDEFIAALVKRVSEETPGGPDNVILIYLSAQGVMADGKPCLLAAAEPRVEKELAQAPTPSEILNSRRLVDLKTLLGKLAHEHPQAWKVVLLDAVRWERNWRLGLAENHFADALGPLMAQFSPTKNSDRIVLLQSCSPGEIGLADPVRERTLFGDAIASGLAGEADTSRDGRIALGELANYVSRQVAAAADRRGRRQQPQLFFAGGEQNRIDFAVARTNRTRFAPRPPTGDIARRVSEFAARWDRLPAAKNGGIAAPLVTPLERSRQELLRHESVLLAGKAYRQVMEPAVPTTWPAAMESPPPTVSLPLSLPAVHDSLGAIESGAAGWASRFAPPPPEQPDPLANLAPHERLYGLWGALRQRGAKPELLFQRAGIDRTGGLPVELHSSFRFRHENPHLPARFRASGDAGRSLENFLDCRQAAERAAFAGGDPRTHTWIAAAVEQGDAKRREAEDLLFAGGLDSDILQRLAAAQESYQTAMTTSQDAARAFALRDQALADMPYWLEWASSGDEERVQLGMRLIDGARQLELVLDETADTSSAEKVNDAANQVEQVLRKLEESVAAATTRCLDASFHLGYLPELEQLLAVPLTDPARRQRLWDKYFSVLQSDQVEAAASADAAKVPAERAAANKLLAHWLKRRDAAGARFDALAKAGRDELLKGEKDFALAENELRAKLAEADRTIRALTPWLTLVEVRQPASEGDGARAELPGRHGAVLREQCARHDYYLWQADRFLEDFLGNDDGQYREVMTLLGRDTLEPYCTASAAQLVEAASRLFPREADPPQRKKLAQLRAAAGALARHFDQPLRPASDGTPPDASEVTIQTPRADPAVAPLPAGQGALQLAGADFDRDGSGVAVQLDPPRDAAAATSSSFGFPIPGPLGTASPPCILPAQFRFLLPSVRKPTWQVAAYYRGHAGRLALELDELKRGHLILSQRALERGKLTVNSSLTDGTVVIVLDCSASMNDANRLWMGEAVQAVRKIIGQLLETRRIEVVLVLFAHRRGIPQAIARERVTELPWNDSFGGDQESVMFEDDFQTVWRGTQMDAKLRSILESEPPRIQARGYTPLYSAVRHAVIDGFSSNRRGARQLVIISDGGDNIRLPQSANGTPVEVETKPAWIRDRNYNTDEEKSKRAAAARDAIQRLGGVELSLIYLAGLDGDRSPVEETKRLLGIANERTFEISKKKAIAGQRNVDSLVTSLGESVGIYSYSIVDERGNKQPGSTAERLEYTVHGRSTVEWNDAVHATFEIEGDESLLAEMRRQGKQRRIHFLGGEELDDDTAVQRVKLAAAEARPLSEQALYPQEYLVACRAEKPKVGDRHRTFRVTFRAVEPGRFTPRPSETWVEVVPAQRGADGQPVRLADAEPYFFSQPTFVPASPIPVVELIAPNWPAGAETALVNLWLRMTDSRDVIKLDELGPKRPNVAEFSEGKFAYSIDHPPGRQQWAIKVVETQSRPASGQPSWAIITLEGTPADEVERQYYPENGRVEHYFIFRDLQKADLGQRAVNVVPQSVWKNSATTLPKEFAVTIPKN